MKKFLLSQSLLSKILRKVRMTLRINPSLWGLPALKQRDCQLKKFFSDPTPWLFKERMNKNPERRSPFNSKRQRKTSKKLYHLKRKRQKKFKRKIKKYIPRQMLSRPQKKRITNQRAKCFRLSLAVKWSRENSKRRYLRNYSIRWRSLVVLARRIEQMNPLHR